ncbi:MAG: OmpA family protein [Bryobacteraceae bacterium]|nr:OmpA family protein [Bryobacteraceae bacterium]
MKRFAVATLILAGSLGAQVAPNPTTNNIVVENAGNPLFKVTVVSRSTKAVNYRFRGGETTVEFKGTAISPQTEGRAKVEGKKGYVQVEVELSKLPSPKSFGPEYLTLVLWAITPEGRAKNLGEVVGGSDGKTRLEVTTEMQTFGMIVTAEPYFAVTQPSDVVVAENIIRSDTEGRIEVVDAKYELLKRGSYVYHPNDSTVKTLPKDYWKNINLYEARNAVQIAKWTGADKYAADTYKKAVDLLAQAEDYQRRKQWKPVSTVSREAAQVSEDARIITLTRMEEERLGMERKSAADREAAERASAEEARRQQQLEAERRAAAEKQTLAAEASRRTAEQERLAAQNAKAEADIARLAAEKASAEAGTARLAAERASADAQAQQQLLAQQAAAAKAAAETSERGRLSAEAEKQALRDQIRNQLNTILETRESARGLIVNLSDVLFDFGKYTLRQGTREKLAKVSGIILAHPGLRIEVEGHTDSVGSEDFNQKLSEQRAGAVRDYLTGQGLKQDMISARGFGKTQPVASNDTSEGRQQNRRVELVVSGDVIGTKTTTTTTTTTVPR